MSKTPTTLTFDSVRDVSREELIIFLHKQVKRTEGRMASFGKEWAEKPTSAVFGNDSEEWTLTLPGLRDTYSSLLRTFEDACNSDRFDAMRAHLISQAVSMAARGRASSWSDRGAAQAYAEVAQFIIQGYAL